jgi:plasmid stabilization system protein ParE
MIIVSEPAQDDIAGLLIATQAAWGRAKAQRCGAMLTDALRLIEGQPLMGERVQGFEVRCFVMRTRRQAHGRRIFHRPVEDGIEVIRILHTALNWRQVLDHDNSI